MDNRDTSLYVRKLRRLGGHELDYVLLNCIDGTKRKEIGQKGHQILMRRRFMYQKSLLKSNDMKI